MAVQQHYLIRPIYMQCETMILQEEERRSAVRCGVISRDIARGSNVGVPLLGMHSLTTLITSNPVLPNR